MCYQLGFVERETDQILRGSTSRHEEVPLPAVPATDELPPRELSEDDVCPICQDEFLRCVGL